MQGEAKQMVRPLDWEYDGLRGIYRWSRREGNGVAFAALFALVIVLGHSGPWLRGFGWGIVFSGLVLAVSAVLS
jgi:hypothetical protein